MDAQAIHLSSFTIAILSQATCLSQDNLLSTSQLSSSCATPHQLLMFGLIEEQFRSRFGCDPTARAYLAR